ncbi:MAG: hypothetical protein FWG13_03870 [Leptospirales bacterium]|nr:hypothetical protein [Leptospirales bacterium]
MGKIVRKTSEEIDKEWPPERVAAHLSRKDIPSFDPEELGHKPGMTIARGIEEFQAYQKYSIKNNIKTNKDFNDALIRDGILSPDGKPIYKGKKDISLMAQLKLKANSSDKLNANSDEKPARKTKKQPAQKAHRTA